VFASFRIAAWVFAAFAAVAGAQAAERVRVAVGTEGFVHVPLYLAIDAGLMKSEGIDIDVIQFRGGGAAMAGLASGNAEFCSCSVQNAVNAAAKGTDVRLVGTLISQYASNVVIRGDVAERLRITNDTPAKDRVTALRGLTIAVSGAGGSADFLMRYLGRQAGLSSERDFTILYMSGNGPMLAAFAQKRIDGFALSSPTSDAAMVRYKGMMLLNMARGEWEGLRGYPSIALSGRLSWLKSHEDTAHRFLRALGLADRMLHEKPDSAKAIVKKRFAGIETAIYDAAWESNLATYPANPRIEEADVARAIAFLVGIQGQKVPGAARDYVDDSYVDAAIASLK
jgi:NitT/TauT family transport system substrate-binding protein